MPDPNPSTGSERAGRGIYTATKKRLHMTNRADTRSFNCHITFLLGELLPLEPKRVTLRKNPENYTSVEGMLPQRLTAPLSLRHRLFFLLAARFLPCAAEICFGLFFPKTFRTSFFLSRNLRLRPVRGTCGLVLTRFYPEARQLQAQQQEAAVPAFQPLSARVNP